MAEALAVYGCENRHDLEVAFSTASTVEKSCPNFVKIDNNGTIRFVHHSVKDFLTSSIDSMDIISAQVMMAKVCITYLNFKDLPLLVNRSSHHCSGDMVKVNEHFKSLQYASFLLYAHMGTLPHDHELLAELVRLLRAHKCYSDPRNGFPEPILLAINKGSRLLVTKFLDAGCEGYGKSSARDETGLQEPPPLHRSITAGRVDVALFLLARGAMVKSQDEQKITPLHLVIGTKHELLVEKLVKFEGLHLNLQGVDGRTPIHWAVMETMEHSSKAILRRVVSDSRVDMRVAANDRRTPFTWTAYWGKKNGNKNYPQGFHIVRIAQRG